MYKRSWVNFSKTSKRQIEETILPVINAIFHHQESKKKVYDCMQTKVAAQHLCDSIFFLHFLRVMMYLLSDTWIPDNGKSESVMICSSVILDSIVFAIHNPIKSINAYIKNNFHEHILKLQKMLNSSHARNNCLLLKSRHTVQQKPLTAIKRKLGQNENLIVTKRLALSNNIKASMRNVHVSPNIILNAAIMQLCLTQAYFLSSSKLFNFVNSIKRFPMNVDEHCTLAAIVDISFNRSRTKFLEVNSEYCTCHTKCLGYNIPCDIMKDILQVALDRNTTLLCCQRCMLSPLVRNTRAKKPRLSISAFNPGLHTCSLDGCSIFRSVPLYSAKYEGFGKYKYQHIFFLNQLHQHIG